MNIFAALADPTRLHIFELIAQGEKSAGEIVKQFSFTAPTISQHLRILRTAKLVRVRAQGQKRLYTVDEAGMIQLEAWVKQQRQEWSRNLDALEAHLATTDAPEQHRA